MKKNSRHFGFLMLYLLLIFSVSFLSGCSEFFNHSRYPDLRKVTVDMQPEKDSGRILQMQKMKLLRAIRYVEKSEALAWKSPLDILIKSNATSRSPFLEKVSENKKILKSKLCVSTRIKRMISERNTPWDAGWFLFIVLFIVLIGVIIGIAIFAKPETGLNGCFLWAIIILLVFCLIFVLVGVDR